MRGRLEMIGNARPSHHLLASLPFWRDDLSGPEALGPLPKSLAEIIKSTT